MGRGPSTVLAGSLVFFKFANVGFFFFAFCFFKRTAKWYKLQGAIKPGFTPGCILVEASVRAQWVRHLERSVVRVSVQVTPMGPAVRPRRRGTDSASHRLVEACSRPGSGLGQPTQSPSTGARVPVTIVYVSKGRQPELLLLCSVASQTWVALISSRKSE